MERKGGGERGREGVRWRGREDQNEEEGNIRGYETYHGAS